VQGSFAGPDELRLALFDHLISKLAPAMRAAYSQAPDWADGVRDALQELLRRLDAHANLARFLIVDSATGDAPMLARREEVLGDLAAALDADRPLAPQEAGPPPFGSEATVKALAAVLHGRLSTDPPPPLCELSGPLMGFIMLPHLGSGAARGELQRAPAAPPGLLPSAGRPALSEAFRVTYRTAGVLAAIAEWPGMSNRQIAAAAGVAHESQISRLLDRLRRLGLVERERGAGAGRVANAWRLTDTGSAVLAEIPWPPGEHDQQIF